MRLKWLRLKWTTTIRVSPKKLLESLDTDLVKEINHVRETKTTLERLCFPKKDMKLGLHYGVVWNPKRNAVTVIMYAPIAEYEPTEDRKK